MRRWWPEISAVAAGVALALVASGGDGADEGQTRKLLTGARDGLQLHAELLRSDGLIAVEARVENRRGRPVLLAPDQCGRVTRALLVRTTPQPEGRRWAGSLQAVKRLVLRGQESRQAPEPLAPAAPGCGRPGRVARLAPGDVVRERWQMQAHHAYTLDEVGADGALVRVELEEAGARRALRVEAPASDVLDDPPAKPAPSAGQVYDRLLEDVRLRSWLAAQPAGSWRSADLLLGDRVQFSAVTTRYERAALARAAADGSGVTVSLPGAEDRLRRFRTRAATLPSGVPLLSRESEWEPARDVVAPPLELPSGRIVADGFPSRASQPLEQRVEPGAYPVHVTVARHGRKRFDGVALATLVVSDRKPVRWRRIGGIGVDGGVAAFTSLEGAWALGRVGPSETYYERAFRSLTAHRNQVTEVPVDDELNQVMFSTGAGDGGYPLLAGFDAEGRPARFVLDFFLLHLAWPGRPAP